MYKMKQNRTWSNSLCTVLAFLSLFFLSSTNIFAEEAHTDIKIRQQIQTNHDYSLPKDRFTYVMEALTKDAPLPNGAKERYVFDLIGEEEQELTLHFQKPGDYRYRVDQRANPNVQYVTQDKEVYELHVTVSQTNQGLVTREVMIVNGSRHKTTDMSFTNVYRFPKRVIQMKKERLPQTGEEMLRTTLLGLAILVIGLVLFFYKRRDKDDQD